MDKVMTAAEFLDLLAGVLAATASAGSVQLRYAAIASGYSGSGQPALRFDGDGSDTIATYLRLASYATPAAGDRVAVLGTGISSFILGPLV